jgi:hypothetical protein
MAQKSLSKCQQLKLMGNQSVKSGRWIHALHLYNQVTDFVIPVYSY